MKSRKLTKEQKISRALRWSAYGCFGVAAGLVIISFVLTLPPVERSLQSLDQWFRELELFIARYEGIPAFLLIILLFLIKSYIPIIPFSVLFIGCGMVFDEITSLFINALGFSLLCAVKFLIGKRKGGGSAHKLANLSKTVYRFMDFGGKGNKWMLALMRFVPFFPVNTVSRAYGGTEMKLQRFIGFSLLGFMPRLLLWSVIGFNIFDPFSPGFVVPFAFLMVISGASLLLVNTLIDINRKDNENE